MECGKCGRLIPEGGRFCNNCGTAIRKRKLCPQCHYIDAENKVYCAQCGSLLQTIWLRGKTLRRLTRMSLYEGTPKMGIAKGTGELILMDDRLCFTNELGDTMGTVFDAIGMTGSAQKAKRNLFWEFSYKQIAEVSQGKYAGMFTSIVIRLQDGRIFSFSGSVSNNTIMDAYGLLEEYIRYA